jgi:hypothetical protein
MRRNKLACRLKGAATKEAQQAYRQNFSLEHGLFNIGSKRGVNADLVCTKKNMD